MSLNGELWGRTPPLEDPMPKPPEGGTTDLVIRQARIIHELRVELEALKKFTACTRSHPHEAMAQDCELRTEIARLTNELTRLRAAPAPEAGSESKIVIDVGPGGSGSGPAEAAPEPAQEPVMLTDAWLLEQFKHHPNWELSTSNDPECDPNLFWLVHEVKGGRNDREWFLIGEGATPRHAIIAALRAKGQS